MPNFSESLSAWNTDSFSPTLKSEIENLPPGALPLQEGTTQGGIVDDTGITATVIRFTDAGDGVEADFAKPLELERCGEVAAKLFLLDPRRTVVWWRLVGVAGQQQQPRAGTREPANGLDVTGRAVPTHAVVAAAVEDQVERLQLRRGQHVGHQPADLDARSSGPLLGSGQRRWRNIDPGHVKPLTGQVDGIRAGAATEHYRQSNLNNPYVKYYLALAEEGAGNAEEANRLFKEVAEYNFNSAAVACIKNDAMARAKEAMM